MPDNLMIDICDGKYLHLYKLLLLISDYIPFIFYVYYCDNHKY